ncbi:unnamed protein product [Blepharisma stoltei]|uniref:Dickkopf N-terminal cysteine-rich domain-containing protein n=1 Tax=Blepharisma stoltei TaxID=1481888 RepID=A0AAU9JWK8_9CILI|nr:unnamed protein product [Blepharisma stoltei]
MGISFRSIFSIFFSLAVYSLDCYKFNCKSSDMLFVNETCIFYEPTQGKYWLNECPKYFYCPIPAPIQEINSTCQYIPKPSSYLWPGEPCTSNSSCITNACIDSICIGNTAGESCKSDGDCNPGLFCNSEKCTQQINTGSYGCSRDEDCVNSSFCNFTGNPATSICVLGYSLASSQAIANCENGVSNLCQNIACIGGNNPVCNVKLSSQLLPKACQSSNDCQIDGNLSEYLPSCECAFNPNGKAYCGLYPGDKLYQQYLIMLQDWIKSDIINKCNTERRGISPCMQAYYPNYLKLAYYASLVSAYPQLQNAPNCAQQIYLSNYWGFLQQINDQDEYSNSNQILLSLALLFILY